MLFIDFGVGMAEGLNGVGMRAVELAHAAMQSVDVKLVVSDTPSAEILEIWPNLSLIASEHLRLGPGDLLWYGFATPPQRVAACKTAGATCLFDAIVWPLEYGIYEAVRSADDQVGAYSKHLSNYLDRLRLADAFVIASHVEQHALMAVLSVCDANRLFASKRPLDRQFFILPVGFSERNELSAFGNVAGPLVDGAIFVWNGGLWNHYAPLAALEGLALSLSSGCDAELWFLYPQRGTPTAAYLETRRAAETHPVLRKRIRFFDGGLGLRKRVEVLSNAKAAIALYRPHPLWDLCPPMRLRESLVFELPIIAPRRGALGDLVAENGIGFTTPNLTPEAIAETIQQCLGSQPQAASRSALKKARSEYLYEARIGDLLQWTSHPD